MMNKDCNCQHSFSTVTEYPCTMRACIKPKKPDCTPMAVIPSITVDSTDGITELANCFVHVTTINTTYYVDDKHRIMLVWAGPVEATGYDTEANPSGLRSQFCFTDGVMYYFDKQGVAHLISEGV